METLLKEINDILIAKNTKISLLKWEIESLNKENAELKKENEALKFDVSKYEENEDNRRSNRSVE